MLLSILPATEIKNLSWALGITLGSLLIYQLLFFVLKKWAGNKERFLPGLLQKYIHIPGLVLILILNLNTGLLFFKPFLNDSVFEALRIGFEVLLVLSVAYLISKGFTVVRELLLRRYKKEDLADFSYRKANTKYQLLEKVLNVVLVILVIGALILTFDTGRKWSSGLLASAGVVGLVIGFAAQKSLGTLFAGFQVAVSEPIRLDDLVEVEGLQGIITEINLTYVVVRGYDGNNLIVPINYFLENSFNNWTRVSPKVMATVKVAADYTLPVEEVRKECMQWIEQSPLWDKRAKTFLVTNTTEKTIELRARMSAANPDDAFDLECHIREKLVTYISEKYPNSLPRERNYISTKQ